MDWCSRIQGKTSCAAARAFAGGRLDGQRLQVNARVALWRNHVHMRREMVPGQHDHPNGVMAVHCRHKHLIRNHCALSKPPAAPAGFFGLLSLLISNKSLASLLLIS